MPIYEYACPKCRVVFNFLSRRVNPGHLPVCPKCGNKQMARQMSGFAALRGRGQASDAPSPEAGPDTGDPRMERAMNEMARDMEHLDENNPRHLAHLMRKMKDLMPPAAPPPKWKPPSNASRPAKTRKKSRRTWATFSARLDPKAPAAARAVIPAIPLHDY